MKKILPLLLVIIAILSGTLFSQNIGVGTTSPTNTLHVIVAPSNPNPNPVRFEGIQRYTNEDSVLVVNPSTGVVKYMPMADVLSNIPPNILDSLILNSVLNNTDTIYNNQSVRDSIISIALGNSDTLFSTQTFKDSVLGTILSNMDTIFTITRDSLLTDSTFINTLRDSVDTDIDSMVFVNDTLYLYEDNQMLTAYINASTDTNLVDSLIVANSDTLYTIISDSLLQDTLWIKNLDSLLSIYGDTIYFNDSSFVLIRDSLLGDTLFIDSLYSIISDSLLNDSLWIDSLGKLINDNDWNINANGTGLEAAPAGNNVASGQYAIAAGYLDSATAQYATVSGGGFNKASGITSTVGGGADNYAFGNSSTIAGGQDNVAINAYSSIGGGFNDTTDGDYATVSGGIENRASAYGAFIGGGQTNKATNNYSVIGGGYLNNATGSYSFIGSGLSDTATGQYSAIVGGNQNKATGSYSSVTGGYQNLAQGSYSTVGGYRDTVSGGTANAVLSGRDNKVTNGAYSTIYGGYQNKLLNSSYASLNGYRSYISSGTYSFAHGREDSIVRNLDGTFISGYQNVSIAENGAWTGRNNILGYRNKIRIIAAAGTGSHSLSILGGYDNLIYGMPGVGTVIVGGAENKYIDTIRDGYQCGMFAGVRNLMTANSMGSPSYTASVILGGQNDTLDATGNSAIVAGGLNKIVGGLRSGTFVGLRNKIYNSWRSTIVGGNFHLINGGNNQSSIIAGDTNVINNSADNAVILGGRKNTANNFSQVVLGHYSTNTIPTGSSAGSIDPDNIILKIGNGTDASNLSDAMVVKANGNVGINNSTPTNQLHIAGGTDPLRLEGLQTGGSTDSVLVTDGTGVVKKTSLNSISRVCGDYTFTNLEGETVVSHGLFCVANNRIFTLPAANLVTGRKYVVKLETIPTTATISATSGNIDGGANYEMVGAGVSSVILQSDGANYWIIGSH